jgi:hypothetical protein
MHWSEHQNKGKTTYVCVLSMQRWGVEEQCVDYASAVGRDSSVGIATRYRLDGPGVESQRRARFDAPVHTGPGAHPTSYTLGTGSLRGGHSGRGVALTTHHHLALRLKKE